MLNHSTISKLYEMKMSVMAQSFREQLRNLTFDELSFEERVGLMVDAEWTSRRSNRLARLIRNADFVFSDACVENIEYHIDRKLDKSQILRLSTCTYIQEAHNIILLGATGSGKTWISNAFGMSACRNFYPVRYIRLPDLLGELAIARGEGTYRKVIKNYKQVSLLILDEWLLFPLKETEARDVLEIIEGRYKKASTIFCSQFEVGGWYNKIGEPTLADAISDRIVHDSYTIIIKGNTSMRERKGISE